MKISTVLACDVYEAVFLLFHIFRYYLALGIGGSSLKSLFVFFIQFPSFLRISFHLREILFLFVFLNFVPGFLKECHLFFLVIYRQFAQEKALYSLSSKVHLKYAFYWWFLCESVRMIPQDQCLVYLRHECSKNAFQLEALAKLPLKKYHCKKYNLHSRVIIFLSLLSSVEILPLIRLTFKVL